MEYLKELKKEDNNLFREELEKYEDSICEENLKKEFGINKISAIDKIIKLISEIAGLVFFKIVELKKELKNLFIKLKEVNNKKFKLNFQILPLDNKELYLNILYEILCASFYNKIRDFENLSFCDKEKYKNYIKKKEIEISQKIDNCKKIKNHKSEEYKILINNIEDEKENLTIFKIEHNKQFKKYLEYINLFYESVINFIQRFLEKPIMNEEDIEIFENFVFFIGNYDFENLNINYINIYQDSFKEFPLDYIRNRIEEINANEYHLFRKSFSLKDGNIKMKFWNTAFIVKDVEKYLFDSLICFLINKYKIDPISDFELLKYLKIQYYDSFLKEKILTNKWQTFLYQVFSSPTISDLVSKMYKNGNIILQKDYKNIIDSVKFFNFNASFLGETFSIYKIYVSGLMKMNQNNQNNNKEKISYYIIILLTYLHEIIDHVLDIIHCNLFDSNISSSEAKDIMNNKASNKRGYESGEDLHVKLFGKLLKELSLEEVCFILDIKNYQEKSYIQFRKNFSKCRNKKFTIPEILEDLIDNKNTNAENFGKIYLNIYLPDEKDNFIIYLLDDNTRICNIIDI